MRLPPFTLERFFAAHEFRVRRTLSSSDCEPLTMRELLELADPEVRERWDALRLGYTESRGLPLLRREIAAMHAGVREDDVLEVVPEEGIFLAMQALVGPGDRAIVTVPAYQSLHEIARGAGAQITGWAPSESGGWRFDPAELRTLAKDGVKLIVVNFPHNPTGWVPSPAEFEEIVAIAREHGAWLFSDEMYRGLEREGVATLPSAVERYEKAVVLGGVSKTLGGPGLRVGWLVCRDAAVLDRVAEGKDWTTICGSAPSEILALAALRARERLLARNRAIIAKNLDALAAFLRAHPGLFEWQAPRGGSVGLARVLREPASALTEWLLREKSLLLLPSSAFDFGDAHARFGLGRADFPDALAHLA